MTPKERLDAFKAAVQAASDRYGVRLTVTSAFGNLVLAEPTLGFLVLPDEPEAPPLSEDLRAALEMARVKPETLPDGFSATAPFGEAYEGSRWVLDHATSTSSTAFVDRDDDNAPLPVGEG